VGKKNQPPASSPSQADLPGSNRAYLVDGGEKSLVETFSQYIP